MRPSRPGRAARIARPVALGGALLAALGGCQAGTGNGYADGTLFVKYCSDARYQTESPRSDYHLGPDYFGGEPFEDVRKPPRANRLVVRMQKSGKRIENNDLLIFDFVDSAEVAKCVRGRVTGGKPEYNTAFCAQGPTGPRLRIGMDYPVHAFLVPRVTCPPPSEKDKEAGIVGTAIPAALDGASGDWASWIELGAFGAAAHPDEANAPIDPGFKVQFGERVMATAFHLTLVDDRVINAIKERDPVPRPEVAGELSGFFDFVLRRAQGAQTFP